MHPREAKAASREKLRDGGFSNDSIVLLTKLIGIVLLQVRAVSGLRSIALGREMQRHLAADPCP